MILNWAILILLIFCLGCEALFEDQVGKFDWTARHLGCFSQVQLTRSESGDELLLASTEKNTLGRINVNTGDLLWRQNNEDNFTQPPQFSVKDSRIVVLLNNGEFVRSFDSAMGALKWQQKLKIDTSKKVKFAHSKKVVAVLSNSGVTIIVGNERVNQRWTANLDSESQWIDIIVTEDHSIVVVGISNNNKEIRMVHIDYKTGGIVNIYRHALTNGILPNSCIVTGNYIVCSPGNQGKAGSVFALDILSTSPKPIETLVGPTDLKLEPIPLYPNYFVAHSTLKSFVCSISENVVKIMKTIDRPTLFAAADHYDPTTNLQSVDFAAYYKSQNSIQVFNLLNLNEAVHVKLSQSVVNQADLKIFKFLTSGQGSFQFLIVRNDCEVDFYEASSGVSTTDGKTTSDLALEWVRFEALASISAVEMIDLPLSESQARIESEFGSEDVPIWRSFALRITSQIEQFQRFLVTLGDKIVHSFHLLTTKQATPTFVIRNLLGYEQRPPRKQRCATIPTESEKAAITLERDYFNLRKIIVVTTLSGSVYGLSNDNGDVLWSLNLGNNVVPFRDQLGQPKMPLFIQRSTTYYQYPSQAAVVFNTKRSDESKITFFNPVTGVAVDTINVKNLKRVEILPFPSAEMLQPLLILPEDGKMSFYPELPADYEPPYPVYLMFFDQKAGVLRGTQVDFRKRNLIENWSSNLGFSTEKEKIVALAGKPSHQKVHSQGKVLGDRSVLYKYSNPNLFALASVDELQTAFTISLMDAVSGQILYTARHARSQPPIHLVLCENWLVYTYWNEKARRTEMGVIELYEGREQTNAQHFNSFTTLKHPLTIHAQSYVFSQGVSAIAVSETEQGLTTRSLIIAMPFGGLLEVSRRFVDARRRIDLTPEMRDEMIIPYMPELPVSTEDLINYNQSLHHIQGIKTASSGLESTSLVFVYGLDMFYTRVTPSGTFDILKDDFDYVLIALVVTVLIIASVACKKIWRANNLKQAWK
ncbi:PQQ-like domain-containing protein [Ditylenchus destructor]|uniref:ER membrane protein complex subunit 1 n=1 Tax=Ditylenchus destructor TaxID=166010 RepID=A0AAD4R600_9BILA|nr:PQQ-like domain-containing protein [Ditylenchus destructor]